MPCSGSKKIVVRRRAKEQTKKQKQAKMRAKKQAKKQTKKQTKKQDEEADEEARRTKKPVLRRRAQHAKEDFSAPPGDVQTLRTALQMRNPICGLSMVMAGWRWTNRASKLAQTTRRTTRCCERTPGASASSQGQPG